MSLRRLLRPDLLLERTLAELPLADLLDHGIAALVLDVDRTLLPRRQASRTPGEAAVSDKGAPSVKPPGFEV